LFCACQVHSGTVCAIPILEEQSGERVTFR
jgi:hypothetical protein